MRTLSPNFVASPMMDTIDLAFALLLPCSRRISDSYFFAAPTKTAASGDRRTWSSTPASPARNSRNDKTSGTAISQAYTIAYAYR